MQVRILNRKVLREVPIVLHAYGARNVYTKVLESHEVLQYRDTDKDAWVDAEIVDEHEEECFGEP